MQFYRFSIFFTLICLALGVWYGWESTGTMAGVAQMLWIIVVLSVLEVSLSFDSAADLDGDCLAELLITRAGAAPILLRGTDPGDLEEVTLPGGIGAATTGMIADADGDGGRDLLLAGPTQGVAWIAPR